ncbi:MAG: calcium/sodium antiporter [Deltaproteobacteria bacterium]|uniref:Calcium/sodium antiporter n=1 Tax=Candidatus Zymogenus saltonus TaxID=2844893 RepID=A0A9D8KF87_9DELT|nr:calcium/sodium antiporter [Candidatus Zymogenus saltonus]
MCFDLLMNSLLTAIGFVLLIWGAGLLVNGAVSLAKRAGISNLVIGLTLVAFGTSAPELAASLNAALKGIGDIACGNIVGSNIANLGLVMGASAIFMPIAIKKNTAFWEIPFVIILSVVFWLMEKDLLFNRFDGVVLIILFLVFTIYCIITAKADTDVELDMIEIEIVKEKSLSISRAFFYAASGIVFLAAGSDYLVKGATGLAVNFGVSEAVIAVSIVALGTSLPELITSVIAAYKGEGDISIGNILGSNIFNFLIVGGVSALVRPFTLSRRIFAFDTPVMLFITVILFTIVTTRRKIGRIEGVFYVLFYFAYIAVVYIFPDGLFISK